MAADTRARRHRSTCKLRPRDTGRTPMSTAAYIVSATRQRWWRGTPARYRTIRCPHTNLQYVPQDFAVARTVRRKCGSFPARRRRSLHRHRIEGCKRPQNSRFPVASTRTTACSRPIPPGNFADSADRVTQKRSSSHWGKQSRPHTTAYNSHRPTGLLRSLPTVVGCTRPCCHHIHRLTDTLFPRATQKLPARDRRHRTVEILWRTDTTMAIHSQAWSRMCNLERTKIPKVHRVEPDTCRSQQDSRHHPNTENPRHQAVDNERTTWPHPTDLSHGAVPRPPLSHALPRCCRRSGRGPNNGRLRGVAPSRDQTHCSLSTSRRTMRSWPR